MNGPIVGERTVPHTTTTTTGPVRPTALRRGDRVAAVALASGLAGEIPHRYLAGKRQLEQVFGLEVVEAPHALRDSAWLRRNPRARADDLRWAFERADVAGVITTIGGTDSLRIMPYVDVERLVRTPKVFLGFSDTTIQHLAFLRYGLTTFYGPTMMTGFAETGGIHRHTANAVTATVFEPTPSRELVQATEVTDEFVDWRDPANHGRPRRLRPNSGWRWPHGVGAHDVEGVAVGGCLETLESAKDTDLWPEREVWDGAIFYWEMSTPSPDPSVLQGILEDYAKRGVFDLIAGMLVGRFVRCSDRTERELLDRTTRVLQECGRSELPLVWGMDFGHTTPSDVIANGHPLRIHPSRGAIVVPDTPVLAPDRAEGRI